MRMSHSPLTLLPHPPFLLRTAVTLSLMAQWRASESGKFPLRADRVESWCLTCFMLSDIFVVWPASLKLHAAGGIS